MLKKARVPHQVLNAKYHEMEAHRRPGRPFPGRDDFHQHGRPGNGYHAGGNPEMLARQEAQKRQIDREANPEPYLKILEEMRSLTSQEYKQVLTAGGLHVLGTERHESRRIDNQLRGRSGRQGDPGTSRFYLSLEDDLLRIFGSQRISGVMSRLGMEEGQPIEHP